MPEAKFENSPLTLASAIAERLREQIARGEILPGQKLRLDDLRAAFGVSLSPLREALSRLSAESDGFVVMEDQRGYRVAPVSADNLVEVTKLRAEYECFALREAIRQGDDTWESEIIAALYRLDKIGRNESDPERMQQWEIAHRILHQTLLSACRMPLLLQFCATLHDRSDRYRRLFLKRHPIDRDVAQEHQDICKAAVDRRADDAATLLRRHIERTGTNVLHALTERHAADAGTAAVEP